MNNSETNKREMGNKCCILSCGLSKRVLKNLKLFKFPLNADSLPFWLSASKIIAADAPKKRIMKSIIKRKTQE